MMVGDHAVQDENIRFIHIAIFHAPGQTYEKDEIRRFQAELLHCAHYVANTLFPSYGYIWAAFLLSWYKACFNVFMESWSAPHTMVINSSFHNVRIKPKLLL